MEGLPEVCSICFFTLDLKHGAYSICEICEVAKVCPLCVITQEVPTCMECKNIQTNLDEEHKIKKQKMPECHACLNVWETNFCEECKKYYCKKCNIPKHPCLKCSNPRCTNEKSHFCCYKKWCKGCYETHRSKDCEITCWRPCQKCYAKVLIFGPDTNKCQVNGCIFQFDYPCLKCHRFRFNKAVYCNDHVGTVSCRGCKRFYPLDPRKPTGYVKILSLLGNKVRKNGYCNECFQKVRALVESSMIIIKRSKWVFPKVLMDKIVYFTFSSTL